jgi:DNA-damage-inducible protein D
MKNKLAIFEDYKIRRVYDENTETCYFSVVDIIQALLQQSDYQTARKFLRASWGQVFLCHYCCVARSAP